MLVVVVMVQCTGVVGGAAFCSQELPSVSQSVCVCAGGVGWVGEAIYIFNRRRTMSLYFSEPKIQMILFFAVFCDIDSETVSFILRRTVL